MHEPAQPSPRSALNRHGTKLFHQLFDRGFNWVVASEAAFDIGVLSRVAAQSWVAYDLTGSSLWVGAVAAFRTGTIAFAYAPSLPTTLIILFIMGIASITTPITAFIASPAFRRS